MIETSHIDIAIIGAGPAGLMAAEVLTEAGFRVDLFDAMPSVGRKFLMAGKSGLNLTHSEDLEMFLSRYFESDPVLEQALRDFTPEDVCDWAHRLGIETFVGTSGRVFPTDYKAAPLLRRWLSRLRENGLRTHVRHRWQGFEGEVLRFETPGGVKDIQARVTLLALGGKSWPSLGSDARWINYFQGTPLQMKPFRASNCGFEVNWSEVFCEKFAGSPVKTVGLSDGKIRFKGEFVISSYGVEGSAIYRLSSPLLKANAQYLVLDLLPDRSFESILSLLEKPRGRKSLSAYLRSALKLSPVKVALLRECTSQEVFSDMKQLARAIKELALPLKGPRPIDEAISSAGGVCFDNLDETLMVKKRPGLFMAGEMLDWDAPTGGYLLTACFALGYRAAHGMKTYLNSDLGQGTH